MSDSKKSNKSYRKPFFDIPEVWEEHWQGMPEFDMENQNAFKTVIVHFQNEQDIKVFAKLVDQKITARTRSIWYPKVTHEQLLSKRYADEEKDES